MDHHEVPGGAGRTDVSRPLSPGRGRRFLGVLLALGSLLGALPAHGLPRPDGQTRPEPAREVREAQDALLAARLQAFLAEVGGRPEAELAGETLRAMPALEELYRGRGFRPLWTGEAAPPGLGAALIGFLGASGERGLRPDDYHAGTLAALVEAREEGDPLDLELLISDGWLLQAHHLREGRLDRRGRFRGTVPPGTGLPGLLEAAFEDDGPLAALEASEPTGAAYRRLRAALSRYRAIAAAGGWETGLDLEGLEPGAEGRGVAALRRRLTVSGDLREDVAAVRLESGRPVAVGPGEDESFDETLAGALRLFQARHGLEPVGRVGPATSAALGVTVEERIRQIELNLDRWRALPSPPDRYVLVNVPAFLVDLVEGDTVTMRIRAIVGRTDRPTPSFEAEMTSVVFSPFWHVPPSIAVRDKLPLIRRDPGYLAASHMLLLDRGSGAAVDPSTVDWSRITASEFTEAYRLRQDPGPWNALGQVKFVFPNPYGVFMHDTDARTLFERTSRCFSSGCVRIQNPLDLAERLLSDDPAWNRSGIEEAAGAGEERAVRLRRPVRVFVGYWTAWVDLDGTVNFPPDVYRRDPPALAALPRPPA